MFVALFRVGGLREEVQEDLFDRFLKGATSENASEGVLRLKQEARKVLSGKVRNSLRWCLL